MRRVVEMTRCRVVIPIVAIIVLTIGLGACGSSSSKPQNTSITPPSITTQPQSQTIISGLTATLSVAATGTAPLSYQWYQGSSGTTTNPISGATNSSYTTAALTATTSYWVQVSNSAGSANSSTATITVTVGQARSIPATFFGFTVNKSCSISQTDAAGQSCNNPEPHSFPGLPFAWSRSLGSGKQTWSDIVVCDPAGSSCPAVAGCTPNTKAATDPTNCAYDWTTFDFFTKTYNAHGVDWMFDAYYTPDYLSVRGSRCTGPGTSISGSDPTCVGAADQCTGATGELGGCDPPSDIDSVPGNGDAAGSNQNYKNFVTALVAHLQQTSPAETIQYWEVWNEPNICTEWNHSDQPNVNCAATNGPSTGTVAQLVRMAKDARAILPASVKITTPPVTDVSGINNYLNQILASGASFFDVIGFHGYFNTPNGACPTACPVPEFFVNEWSALTTVAGTSKPAMNSEFSWGAKSSTTDPDMRAAFTARSYLLQESEYPALARVAWYGEDFAINTTVTPNTGTGEFWASGATNAADNCTTPDSVQGGFDCPAGLAMNQVEKWTIGAKFASACTCSASPNGGNCFPARPSPPTGIFQCSVVQASGKPGLLVWDNTAVTFPCSNAPCGTTNFPIPSSLTSDWQDLNGNKTSLNGSTTVMIGAKPILIE